MSQFTKKVVAVLDTQSAFGVTIKSMRDSLNTLTAGQVSVLTTEPSNPSEGQLWFDKSCLKMKIYITDGNSNQWVEI